MILGIKRVKSAGLALIALGVLASSVAATPAQVLFVRTHLCSALVGHLL